MLFISLVEKREKSGTFSHFRFFHCLESDNITVITFHKFIFKKTVLNWTLLNSLILRFILTASGIFPSMKIHAADKSTHEFAVLKYTHRSLFYILWNLLSEPSERVPLHKRLYLFVSFLLNNELAIFI